jgi:hypothetical protein
MSNFSDFCSRVIEFTHYATTPEGERIMELAVTRDKHLPLPQPSRYFKEVFVDVPTENGSTERTEVLEPVERIILELEDGTEAETFVALDFANKLCGPDNRRLFLQGTKAADLGLPSPRKPAPRLRRRQRRQAAQRGSTK